MPRVRLVVAATFRSQACGEKRLNAVRRLQSSEERVANVEMVDRGRK